MDATISSSDQTGVTSPQPAGYLLTKQQLADYDYYLLTKEQLAERLGLKVRGVESLAASRKIPAIRISGRCVRFSWPRVLAALRKLEVEAIQ